MDISLRDPIDVLILKAIENHRFRIGQISKIVMGNDILKRIIRARGSNQYNLQPVGYNRYFGIDVQRDNSVKGFRLIPEVSK